MSRHLKTPSPSLPRDRGLVRRINRGPGLPGLEQVALGDKGKVVGAGIDERLVTLIRILVFLDDFVKPRRRPLQTLRSDFEVTSKCTSNSLQSHLQGYFNVTSNTP